MLLFNILSLFCFSIVVVFLLVYIVRSCIVRSLLYNISFIICFSFFFFQAAFGQVIIINNLRVILKHLVELI